VKEAIYPNNKLRVIIRDDAPLMFANDSPVYRSVEIKLTDEQVGLLKLNWIGMTNNNDYYESITNSSLCEGFNSAISQIEEGLK